LVKSFGYPAIGVAACILAVLAVGLFSQVRRADRVALGAAA
jgi:hypothetical protein